MEYGRLPGIEADSDIFTFGCKLGTPDGHIVYSVDRNRIHLFSFRNLLLGQI
jgi:hypothetical protein